MVNFDYPQKDWYKHVKLCGCTGCIAASREQSRKQESSTVKTMNHGYLDSGILKNDSTPELPLSPQNSSPRNFVPTISFDTVPIQGVSPDDEDAEDYYDYSHPYSNPEGSSSQLNYTLEEYYNNEDTSYYADYQGSRGYLGIDDWNSGASTAASKSPSKYSGRAFSAAKFDVLPDGRRVRIDYPSKPTILSDSFVINKTHKDWRQKWKERKVQIEMRKFHEDSLWYRYPDILFPKTNVDLSDLPVINDEGVAYNSNERANMKRIAKVVRTPVGFPVSPRIILCHISGRMHTWVALDWALKSFITDSDHVVVVANLPKMASRFGRSSRSTSRSRSRSRSRSVRRSSSTNPNSSFGSHNVETMVKYKNEEWCEGYTVGDIEQVLANLIQYITFIIPPTRAIKITVEIMIGTTKQVMIEVLNLHSPDLLVAATTQYKENDSLIEHGSQRLTSVLATYYPLPVFLIPAKRMFLFGMQLEKGIINKQKLLYGMPDRQKIISVKSTPVLPSNSTAAASKKELLAGVLHDDDEQDHGDDDDDGRDDDDDDDDDDDEKEDVEEPSFILGGEREIDDSEITSIDSEESRSIAENGDETNNLKNSMTRVSKLRDYYRQKIQKSFSMINQNPSLSAQEKYVSKFNTVINASIKFTNELESTNSPSILELQRIITGGEKHKGFRKKSMLDVVDLPVSKPKPKQQAVNVGRSVPGDPTPKKSTRIKFEANVKGVDGSTALQQYTNEDPLGELPPLRQVKSLSQSNLKKYGSNTSLRKVHSASNGGVLNSSKSNDYATLSNNKRKRGFLGSLFGSSRTGSASSINPNITSPPTSRRSSISSNENIAAVTSNIGKRKKKWGFLK
ncbi:uncharacterized protein Ecym_5591 [Eremothecium cymbalariae DBVPG|uniref:Uncharacterized protein n=1 Tax=Eremothecium cymbalariae (strain CBS 270.75 / DBVPG 7215 / KCTC 17166 / NRRL Y-17582) TaxID=931890 RepID=I6NE36_ERECY|nr:hypothetical protein Ecym_5591 [Eremothecium cymbalariae DBVPG\